MQEGHPTDTGSTRAAKKQQRLSFVKCKGDPGDTILCDDGSMKNKGEAWSHVQTQRQLDGSIVRAVFGSNLEFIYFYTNFFIRISMFFINKILVFFK